MIVLEEQTTDITAPLDMSQFFFITDLDNTLVGDDAALAELNQHLSRHRNQHGTLITYSTGRSLTLYRELTQEKQLLQPDILVLSVGTVIYRSGGDELDEGWLQYLSDGWDRSLVEAVAAQFPELSPQPESEQTQHKVSYFLKVDAADRVIPALKEMLVDRGLTVQVVYSSGQDLDILPQQGNKGAATRYLQQTLGISPDRTVVCGDSGNDLALFQQVDSRGVIVGNARSELLEWHHNHPSDNRYLATAHCAGGILEGLRHFGFLAA